MAGIDISKLKNAVFDDEEKVENRKIIYVSSKEELDEILKPREIEMNNLMKKGEEAKFQSPCGDYTLIRAPPISGLTMRVQNPVFGGLP